MYVPNIAWAIVILKMICCLSENQIEPWVLYFYLSNLAILSTFYRHDKQISQSSSVKNHFIILKVKTFGYPSGAMNNVTSRKLEIAKFNDKILIGVYYTYHPFSLL